MGYVESGIYVQGLNEMVAGLKAMGADEELRAINLKVGNIVVREAQARVPVRSGALKGSIKTSRQLSGVVVTAGTGQRIPYANAINWGWFYDRKNFIYKNIKPTQFMNKAAARVRDVVGKMYLDDMLAIYNKYAGNKQPEVRADYMNSVPEYTIRRNEV